MNHFFVKSVALTLLVFGSGSAWAKPLALVWNGPGVCPIGCAPAAAKVARMAGYDTRYVTPQNKDQAPFSEARLWVQPGGKSSTAAEAMGPELLTKIRNFVIGGGQYVGFCAGMFLTTAEIGTRGIPGLGIVPGRTQLYLANDPPAHFERVQIGDRIRKVYYAGGPMLHLTEAEAAASHVEILARYSNGDIAAVNVPYGAGRVSVSGFHPESGRLWGVNRLNFDTDGSDRWFAIQMIRKTEH
jgi:glutamine amidotransferase-like uncharacterized protein